MKRAFCRSPTRTSRAPTGTRRVRRSLLQRAKREGFNRTPEFPPVGRTWRARIASHSKCPREAAGICNIGAAMRLAARLFSKSEIGSYLRGAALAALLLMPAACNRHGNAVSGTIEVDEAHVGPRSGGRVEKILAWEGDHLHEGQVIVQLDASELRARRDLAVAQIDTAIHDADAQQAQLQFLRDDSGRQQELLKRRVVSSTDAERADSAAKAQEKNVAAAKMRVAQARAQLADIDAQLAELQVVAPADSILEVLSVKVGDVLPANREAATLLLTGHLWVRVYVPESWL